MIGIYKFTNKINNKSYIGQSVCIEKRYQQHIRSISKSKLPFHMALAKYGIDNFDFEVLVECSKDELNDKEKYYIQQYNSLVPNGYNLQQGGTPTRYEVYYTFTKEDIDFIYDELKNSGKTYVDIAAEYGVTSTLIRYINYGIEYAQDNISYPIRDFEENWKIHNQSVSKQLSGEKSYKASINEMTALKIIYDLIHHQELTSVEIAEKYNTTIDIVKDINRNKSWKYLERPVPCRPDFGNHKITLDDALQLIDILQNTFMPIKEIMKQYPQFSYHMINRINNGENWHQDNINYPIRKYRILTQKLSVELVQELCFDLYTTDLSMGELSKKYNITTQSIYDINNHKAYPYISTKYPNPIRQACIDYPRP